MELTLLQETSITLKELDEMDEERKWIYYYYIVAKIMFENKQIKEKEDEIKNRGRNVKSIDFPDDFVSYIDNKMALKESK